MISQNRINAVKFLAYLLDELNVLILVAFKDAPEELDITIFEKESSDLPSVIQAASELVTKVGIVYLLKSARNAQERLEVV